MVPNPVEYFRCVHKRFNPQVKGMMLNAILIIQFRLLLILYYLSIIYDTKHSMA